MCRVCSPQRACTSCQPSTCQPSAQSNNTGTAVSPRPIPAPSYLPLLPGTSAPLTGILRACGACAGAATASALRFCPGEPPGPGAGSSTRGRVRESGMLKAGGRSLHFACPLPCATPAVLSPAHVILSIAAAPPSCTGRCKPRRRRLLSVPPQRTPGPQRGNVRRSSSDALTARTTHFGLLILHEFTPLLFLGCFQPCERFRCSLCNRFTAARFQGVSRVSAGCFQAQLFQGRFQAGFGSLKLCTSSRAGWDSRGRARRMRLRRQVVALLSRTLLRLCLRDTTRFLRQAEAPALDGAHTEGPRCFLRPGQAQTGQTRLLQTTAVRARSLHPR